MKKIYRMLSIGAIAVITASLLGTNYNPFLGADQNNLPQTEDELMTKVKEMGGLKLVMPSAFAQISEEDAMMMAEEGRNVVEHNVWGRSVDLPTMGGGTYKAMTFNEQVPGPSLRVTQGDIVKVTLTIPEDETSKHGIDMHASQMSAVPDMGAVNLGGSKTYYYIAEVPGTFKYHCSGVNVALMDQHVLSGMYGMTIVDPLNGYKPLITQGTKVVDGKVMTEKTKYSADAMEFQLQYNQLYLDAEGNYDQAAMFQHHQTLSVVNGFSFGYVPNETHNELVLGDKNKNIFVAQPWNSAELKQYQSQLLFVPVGKHVRLFVENQGNEPVYFHIVGEILDRVVQGNKVQAQGVETWLIGGSQGAIIDTVFENAGVYVVVNHDYAEIFTGTASVIVAGDYFGLTEDPIESYADLLGNPSDAIPPAGMNTVAHPKVNLHGLYTDERAAQIADELGIE